MLIKPLELEREALRRLPDIFVDLFDAGAGVQPPHVRPSDTGVDVIADAGGRRWKLEVKASSSPGVVVVVAVAASQLSTVDVEDALAVLVVPYMTPAGARVADERRLNWIDLSGNAHLRGDCLHTWIQGRPNAFVARGRTAAPRRRVVGCRCLRSLVTGRATAMKSSRSSCPPA